TPPPRPRTTTCAERITSVPPHPETLTHAHPTHPRYIEPAQTLRHGRRALRAVHAERRGWPSLRRAAGAAPRSRGRPPRQSPPGTLAATRAAQATRLRRGHRLPRSPWP